MYQNTLQHYSLRTMLTGHGVRVRVQNERMEALSEWAEWLHSEDREVIIISKSCWVDVTDWSIEHARKWLGY